METNRLRQFCTIVETNNLRAAAELLGISHSGLSKSMKVFESELGLELFQTQGRGLKITEEGRSLYDRSSPFFESLEQLLNPKHQAEHVIKMGSFEVFTTYFLGKFLSDYYQASRLEAYELIPGEIEEALLAHQIDLGLSYEPIPKKGIRFLKLGELSMGIYKVKSAFKNKKLEDLPFAIPTSPLSGTPSGSKGLDAWPYKELDRLEFYKVTMMESALELARQGIAVVFIPDFIAVLHNEKVNRDHQLIKHKFPKSVKKVRRNIYLVQREEDQDDSPFIRKLAKAVRIICS